jgi:hypothetical protein
MTEKLSIDEAFAALKYEREQNKKLASKNEKLEESLKTRRARLNCLEGSVRHLKYKLDGIERIESGVSKFQNTNEHVISQELRRLIKNEPDKLQLCEIILRLQEVEVFWRAVQHYAIGKIIGIIRTLKSEKVYEAYIKELKKQKRFEEVAE